MKRIACFRPTPALVVASIALMVALGGTSIAAVGTLIAPNSVGTAQVVDHSLQKQDFKVGLLLRGPTGHAGARGSAGAIGPAGPAGTVDTTNFYTKADSDGRYLRGTLTVVASVTVPAQTGGVSAGGTRASCPAGYQAIGGGVSPENVGTELVSESAPIIDNTDTDLTTDGTHAAATGWVGYIRNVSPDAQYVKVAVICAPIG